ncbi:MAG TPA: methyltransferase domain-containing protein [Gemmatimonadales bacterium]
MSRDRGVEIDLGAGEVRRAPGALRADRSIAVRPDVVLDAERPLPFATSVARRISCFDLLEHIRDVPALMAEIHRVLSPDGTVLITTPHFSCANAFTDPTHRHHFGLRSFDYFTADHPLAYYSTARFRTVRRVLRFHGGPVDAFVRRVAARWPDFYEHRLAWIFPAWYLEIELAAIK